MSFSVDIITGLVVTLVTALLMSIGHLYRTREENVKIRKKALYLLMEIWNRLAVASTVTMEVVVEKTMEVIQEQFPEMPIPENYREGLLERFGPFLVQNFLDSQLQGIDRYAVLYRDAVLLLSSTDPILAFRLSTAGDVEKELKKVEGYFSETMRKPAEEIIEASIVNEFADCMERRLSTTIRKDLEESILELAGKIGWRTKRECNKRFKRVANGRLDLTGFDDVIAQSAAPFINDVKLLLDKVMTRHQSQFDTPSMDLPGKGSSS